MGNEASMESGAKESDNSNDTEQKNDKAIDGMRNEASMDNGAKENDNSNDGERNNGEAIDDRGNKDSMESRTVNIRFHYYYGNYLIMLCRKVKKRFLNLPRNEKGSC